MKQDLGKFFKSALDSLGPSRRFFLICLSFVFAVGIHSFGKFDSWFNALFIVTLLVGPILIILSILARQQFLFLGALLFGITVGLWTYEASLKIPSGDVSFLNGQKVTLRGVIAEESDMRLDHQKLKVSIKSLTSRKDADSNAEKHGRIRGKLLVRTELYPELNYGDEVELTCRLQKPEPVQDFAYDEYLARFNIYSVCYRPDNLVVISGSNGNWFMEKILSFKKFLSENISAALPEPYASLARGTALGERGTIPLEIQENFRRSGLSHILAISGFNITIIVYLVGLFIKSLFKNKRVRFVLTSVGIVLFVLMVGADASVVRAAIMGTLVLLAKSNARIPPPRITLSLAGAAMLALNPKLFAFDRGFLLSFAATIGIIYFSSLLKEYFENLSKIVDRASDGLEEKRITKKHKSEMRKFFGDIVFSTLSAILFTFPLTTYFFKNVSLAALPVNLLVVPITPFIMVMSLAVGIFGFISPLSSLISPLLYAGIYYMNFLARFFAQIPYTSLSLASVHWIILPISYLAIFYVMWILKSRIQSQNLKRIF